MLDDELLTELTMLAKVSAEHAGKFRQSICFDVDQEWHWHARPKIVTEPRPLKHAIIELRRLARSLQSVHTNLQNLHPHALNMLPTASTWIASRTRPDAPPPLLPFDDFAQHKKTIAALAELSSETLRIAQYKSHRPSVGRPAIGKGRWIVDGV